VDAAEVEIQECTAIRGKVVNLYAEGVRESPYWIAFEPGSSAACSERRSRYSAARRTWRTCWGAARRIFGVMTTILQFITSEFRCWHIASFRRYGRQCVQAVAC
jgi:hypothetical protein